MAAGRAAEDRFMVAKVIAGTLLGGVVLFGAAVVSKAKSPGGVGSMSAGAAVDATPVKVISSGQEVDFAEHVADSDVITIFDFTADW